MKKLSREQIDGELFPIGGTAGQWVTRKTDGSLGWAPAAAGESGQVLVSLAGGSFTWLGNLARVIEHGGSIPGDTPAGTIIVELDE